jgi:type IV pilus biogenesis protein CpaD/CtpE
MRPPTLVICAAAGLLLPACATKKPATGGDILTDYARSQVPGSFSAPHTGGKP